MTIRKPGKIDRRALSVSIACVLIAAAIASIDLMVPLGVAMGVPYVAVVLLSLWLPRRATILTAIVCSLLTFGVYFYQPDVPELWKSLSNRFLAVFVIWASAGLGLQRKRAEERRDNAVREREKALDEVRILRGLLPICSSCKRIRTDQGDWEQIERYIRDHSEAEFTHGICADCAKKLYPPEARKPAVGLDAEGRAGQRRSQADRGTLD